VRRVEHLQLAKWRAFGIFVTRQLIQKFLLAAQDLEVHVDVLLILESALESMISQVRAHEITDVARCKLVFVVQHRELILPAEAQWKRRLCKLQEGYEVELD